MQVLVLIGDIIDSRESADRRGLQERFRAAIDAINQERDDLLSPYTITLGDEFQAVFESADRALTDAIKIQAYMHPAKFRFSFSVGEITTEINKHSAIGMDGPAFYRARGAIESMKHGKAYERYRITGASKDADSWMNSCLNLVSLSSKNWKKTRFEVLVEHFSGVDAKDTAAKLKITDKAVYKNISDGGLDDIMIIFERITRLLQDALQEP